jgi:hypothetical protein
MCVRERINYFTLPFNFEILISIKNILPIITPPPYNCLMRYINKY